MSEMLATGSSSADVPLRARSAALRPLGRTDQWDGLNLAVVLVAAAHLVAEALNVAPVLSPISWAVPFFGTGWALASLLFPQKPSRVDRDSSVARVVGSVLLSLAFVSLASTGLAVGWILGSWGVTLVFDLTTIGAGLAALLIGPPSPLALQLPRPGWRHLPAALIGGTAIALFAVWRSATIYPVVNGWDMMTSLVTIQYMGAHGGFAYVLIPPFPASAGIPYPGMYLDFLAGVSLYLGIPPLLIFWWAPLFLIVGFAGLVYLLVVHFSEEPWLAAIVALIGIVLSAPQGESLRSPLYLSPDMVAQLVFLLVISWYVYTRPGAAGRGSVVALGAVFLGLFYFYSLVAALPFLAAMIVGRRRLPVVRTAFRLFVVLEAIVLAGLVALYLVAPREGGALSQFADPTVLPTVSKLGLLVSVYSPVTWLPIGTAVVVFAWNRSKVRMEPLSLWFFGLGAVSTLSEILIPLWVTYRLEFYMRSMVLVFLSSFALGPLRLPARFAHPPNVESHGAIRRNAASRRDQVALVVCFLLPALILVVPLVDYAHSYSAYYSTDEYKAALWIRANLPADAYLATDPGTGYFFRGLAYRNASVYFILGDGRAPWDSSGLYPNLNSKLHYAFTRPYSFNAESSLEQLGIPHLYVLVTSRTPVWVNGDGTQTLTHPVSPSDASALAAFLSPPFFRLMFQTGEVYVFALGS